jgi:hypothetical protein
MLFQTMMRSLSFFYLKGLLCSPGTAKVTVKGEKENTEKDLLLLTHYCLTH